jgi:5-methylcytosine-specific restriction enzyme B
VQQGYFYGLDETFVERLVGRFPQLAAVLTDVSSELRNQDVSVAEAFESFRESVEHSGLIVDPVLLRSFFCSLLAKPFVILTGLSGSGKTQLALKLGNWFGVDSDGRARSVVVPVRPDWTGPEPLLGYEDALSGAEHGEHAWAAPDVLQFLLRAEDDPAHPYVLVLDEMNLAHVERYFADFLSGIESRQPILPNLTRSAAGDWRLTPGEPKRIPIPPNVFVVGTVNVDETTYLFSPKVLDRANSFEFRVLTDDLGTVGGRPTAATEGGDLELRQVLAVVSDDDWHVRAPHPEQAELADRLRGLHRLLAVSGHEFGHRVYGEGLRFAALLAGSGEDDLDTALDLFTMQ